MSTDQAYIQHILAAYPELAVTSAAFNRNGQNTDVLIVNAALVFRFPKFTEGIRQLVKETAILKAIKNAIPLPVPDPLYESLADKKPGAAFIGYPMLPGEPFTKAAFAHAQKNGQLTMIAEQLGQFLLRLHRIPFAQTLPHPRPTTPDKKAPWIDVYERIKAKLYPHMGERAKREVSDRFETYLADDTHFSFETCLIHGDFGASYPGLDPILARMRFYRSTFALQEALFGVEHSDANAFHNGMEHYW